MAGFLLCLFISKLIKIYGNFRYFIDCDNQSTDFIPGCSAAINEGYEFAEFSTVSRRYFYRSNGFNRSRKRSVELTRRNRRGREFEKNESSPSIIIGFEHHESICSILFGFEQYKSIRSIFLEFERHESITPILTNILTKWRCLDSAINVFIAANFN